MPKNRPASLPACFSRIWDELAKADETTRSRRNLASRLRVSTHTLQRILVDGDVPDLSRPQTPYVMGSWIRTLTRIAAGLGKDPWEILESSGIIRDARSESLVRAELAKLPESGRSAGTDQVPDLVGFIVSLLEAQPGAKGSAGYEAQEQLGRSLRQYLVATGAQAPGMASGGDLSEGTYCRSCMASLSDSHNKGASGRYCRYCSDADGKLRPVGEVHEILTRWFMHWQPGISPDEASRRARHYMQAMPAWASESS
jgi:hypothetical protein